MGHEVVSNYYSGQGVVMLGTRDATGKPVQLRQLGNVSDLTISIATTVQEHIESQTGARGVDLRLETEVKATLAATMESFNARNLEIMLRAANTSKWGATVVAEALKLYNGAVIPFANIKASAVVVKRGATTLTLYTNDATPFDYKLNADAGSILMNDGAVAALVGLTTGGVAPPAITVGNPTVVTVANTAVIGEYAVFTGFAGADAALVNSKTAKIVFASPTVVHLDINTVGKTITVGTPLSAFDGVAITADYVYADQKMSAAMTAAAADYFLRFEGLNTADGNKPVVVDVFKFSSDPLKELALISEGIGQFVLEGSVLADMLQVSGSKYFQQRLLR